ncbi:hypothetical protein Tco_0972113 [Tanacetum coccineum]
MVSTHDVYSTKRIMSFISVKVNEWYAYSHLEEIVAKRADQQLYTFKEGDFKRLHLNDIEDMLLLIVQNKLNNLGGNVVVHLVVSLCMFARRTVNQARVEVLQLGPAYTTLLNPRGVIYIDNLKRKIFMRADELYKFSDDTLISVRDTLSQMLHELHLGTRWQKRQKLSLTSRTIGQRTSILLAEETLGDEEDERIDVGYDTDIEDVIEEEEGFVRKGGIGEEEDNLEDDVVVANDICSSMIQTTLNVDVEEDINTKSHELRLFGKKYYYQDSYKDGHGVLEAFVSTINSLEKSGNPITGASIIEVLIIMEYLVKVSKKARILELKRRKMKITDSDNSIRRQKEQKRYSFLLMATVPADYVPAGHVLISADRYRIC